MSIGSFFSGLFGSNPTSVTNYSAQDPYVLANQNPNSAIGQQQTEQQGTYQNQQSLAQALSQQAAGRGPSPSQTMLAQALSQNAANANGMVAANRGHYSGMALRDAMMAQNQANQQAAGTGAAMRQQEQLQAQGQLSGLYGTMNNQNLQQQQLLSSASLGSQAINANLATAGAQANGQATGTGLGALAQAGALGYKFFGGKSSSGGDTDTPDSGNPNSPDFIGPSQPDAGGSDGSIGGSYPATEGYARGGIIPGRPQRLAAGGMTGNSNMDMLTLSGVSPIIAEAGMARPAAPSGGGGLLGGLPGIGGIGGMGGMSGMPGTPNLSGQQSALGGAGEKVNNGFWDWYDNKVENDPNNKTFGVPDTFWRNAGNAGTAIMAHGGVTSHVGSKLRGGGQVPGKAKVPGDSYANDTVDAHLSPGEIVIPRSHAENASMAKDFIDHLMSQKKKASGSGYGKVLEAHRKLGEALKAAGAK